MTTPSPTPAPSGGSASAALQQALAGTGVDLSRIPVPGSSGTSAAARRLVLMGRKPPEGTSPYALLPGDTDPVDGFVLDTERGYIDANGEYQPFSYSDTRDKLAQTRQPTPDLMSTDQAVGKFYTMSESERDRLRTKMIGAGMLDEDATFDETVAAWAKVVDRAADWQSFAPDKGYTPEDIIDLQFGGPDGSPAAPRTKTVVENQRTLTSNDDARALLRNMMRRDLGRTPSEKEVDDFQAKLNEAQTKNPYTRTTTTTYGADGSATGSETTTTGGIDEGGFADSYLENTDPESEYGRYQAATTYFNALMQAIQSPVN